MPRGRPTKALELSDEQRQILESWVRRPKTPQALALRYRIVLESVTGATNQKVARKPLVTGNTVGKWRRRFMAKVTDGLLDEPRPGAPRKLSDADVEQMIPLTLESLPRDATRWSTRSIAKASGMSQSAVSRIWRAFALLPRRVETFKLSSDPLFVYKAHDIVGLYLNPPEKAVVLCVDEKPQIQALDRTQSDLAVRCSRHGQRAITSYLETYNEDLRPFIWNKSADQILENPQRFCQRTFNSGH